MRAKKSFGQHFLISEAIAERIANSLTKTEEYENVLEVGPGKGMLTKYLLEKDWTLHAVEADRDMMSYLQTNYPSFKSAFARRRFFAFRSDDYNW